MTMFLILNIAEAITFVWIGVFIGWNRGYDKGLDDCHKAEASKERSLARPKEPRRKAWWCDE